MPAAVRTPWIDFVTQNVQALPAMTKTHVKEDVQRTFRDGDFVAFQEIIPDYYERAVLDCPPSYRVWLPEDPNGGCALGWRKADWRLIEQGKVLLHKGVPKVSGHRYLVWATLEHRKTGAVLLLYTFHFVADAWNKKIEAHQEIAEELWAKDQVRTLAFLEPFAKLGIPTVGGGDGNRMHNHRQGPLLGERVGRRKIFYVADDRSIDPIMFTNGAEWRWVIDPDGQEHLTNRHSDHGGRKARARLVYRKARK